MRGPHLTHSVAGHEVAPAGPGVADWIPEPLVLPVAARGAPRNGPLRRAAIRPSSPGAAVRQHGGARARRPAAPEPVAARADHPAGRVAGTADHGDGRADV